MLQAGPEGTAQQFYRRHRVVVVSAVLALTGIATGTAAAFALMQAFVFSNVLLIGASALLALLAAYALLRHWGLAVLTGFAPLPGLIGAAPFASGSDFGAIPFLAYGFALAGAILTSEHKLKELLQQDADLTCTMIARWGKGPFVPVLMAVGLMAILVLVWFRNGTSADAALQAIADSTLALFSVLVLLPLGFSVLSFDEAFVARANRACEQHARWLDGLRFASVPRWGLSLTGITLVAIVLGWYGAHGLLQDFLILRSALVILVAFAGGFVGAGWREGLALATAAGTACLLTLWATVIAPNLANSGVIVLQCGTFALLLSFWGAWRTRHHRQQHGAGPAARERVIVDAGGAVIAVIASAGALLPLIILQSGAVVALAGITFAGVAGVLLSPAMVTGLEALFPRRATVEELYGHKRWPKR
jgi:hypothetical protein